MKHIKELNINEGLQSGKLNWMELQKDKKFQDITRKMNPEAFSLFQDQRFLSDIMKGGLSYEVFYNEIRVYLENKEDRILFESSGNTIQIVLKFIGYALGADYVSLEKDESNKYYIKWWWD